jgi:hypothetical protein
MDSKRMSLDIERYKLSGLIADRKTSAGILQSLVRNLQSKVLFWGLSSVGRAPQWHRYPGHFLTLSRLDLMCSTLGKSGKLHDLTFAQIMPKIFHEWIKLNAENVKTPALKDRRW